MYCCCFKILVPDVMTDLNVRNLLNKCFLVFIKKKPAFIIRLVC